MAAAAKRKEVNEGEDGFRSLGKETGLVDGVSVPGASERGAKTIVEASRD